MTAHTTPQQFALTGELIGAPVLTNLEWKVVDLALREAETTGSGGPAFPPTRVRRFLRSVGTALFGWTYAMPLADERLEMLRHFVCALRRDAKRAERLAIRLADLGFSQAKLRTVRLRVEA